MPRSRGNSSSSSSSEGPAPAEDTVVREMDVFLTDTEGLYCLQYPLRPSHGHPLNLVDAYFKPKHKVLEVHADHTAKRDGLLKLSSILAL